MGLTLRLFSYSATHVHTLTLTWQEVTGQGSLGPVTSTPQVLTASTYAWVNVGSMPWIMLLVSCHLGIVNRIACSVTKMPAEGGCMSSQHHAHMPGLLLALLGAHNSSTNRTRKQALD